MTALTLLGARTWWRTAHDRTLAWSCLAYAAWAFAGQNVLWQPRHLLPLAPALACLAGLGASRISRRALPFVCVALVPLAAESLRVMRVQAAVSLVAKSFAGNLLSVF